MHPLARASWLTRLSVVVSALACYSAAQTTWYVDVNAAPPGAGTGANPYTSIQYAISRASTVHGDTIRVYPGDYAENVDFLGKRIQVQSTAGALETSITNPIGSADSVVTFANGESATCVLDGFTIRNGTGKLSDVPSWGILRRGGGVFVYGSSPTIRNCRIQFNNAESGAGMYVYNGSPVCIATTIEYNVTASGGDGGGVDLEEAGLTVIDCVLFRNSANHGGAIWHSYSNPVVRNSLFQENDAVIGGAIFGFAVSQLDVEDSTFLGNHATLAGAVFLQHSGFADIDRCTFAENAANQGGAVGILENGELYANDCTFVDNHAIIGGAGSGNGTYTRCTFTGNTAEALNPYAGHAQGGALADGSAVNCVFVGNRAVGSAPDGEGGAAWNTYLENCTLVENTAMSSGGGISNSYAFRCIIWDNNPDNVRADSTVSYSDVQGGFAGAGNLNIDPRFWSQATGDFHLKPGSPCIDAGWPFNPELDMGAYEYDPAYCLAPISYCTAKTNSLGCVPSIGWTGTPRPSGPETFYVTASNVLNNKSGLFFWGLTPTALPFLGGIRCVQYPVVRTAIVGSHGSPSGNNCTGSYSYFFSHAAMAQKGLVAGSTVYGQFWSRDPGFAAPGSVGLTDAIEFTICE